MGCQCGPVGGHAGGASSTKLAALALLAAEAQPQAGLSPLAVPWCQWRGLEFTEQLRVRLEI